MILENAKKLLCCIFVLCMNMFVACSDDMAEESLPASVSLMPSVEYGFLTDARDNQMYKTVTIGTQTWMAENLNFAYVQPTKTLDSSSFCDHNSADSCAKYGRLYMWSAAMDSAAVFSDDSKDCGDSYGSKCFAVDARGICPENWHLPSNTEWLQLFDAIGGADVAGRLLKSTSGWYNGGDGSDSFGFDVISSSLRYDQDNSVTSGFRAYFWSSTEYEGRAYSWFFNYYYDKVFQEKVYKDYAMSVRCVKD